MLLLNCKTCGRVYDAQNLQNEHYLLCEHLIRVREIHNQEVLKQTKGDKMKTQTKCLLILAFALLALIAEIKIANAMTWEELQAMYVPSRKKIYVVNE